MITLESDCSLLELAEVLQEKELDLSHPFLLHLGVGRLQRVHVLTSVGPEFELRVGAFDRFGQTHVSKLHQNRRYTRRSQRSNCTHGKLEFELVEIVVRERDRRRIRRCGGRLLHHTVLA